MAAQYFIKRGETVKGPFTVEKLQALKKAKKLKAGDRISQSAEGPWESFSVSYKAKQSSEQPNPSPAKPSPKTVACEDCGGIVSKRAHQCPHCGSPIGQSEDQVPSAVAEDTDDEQFGAYYDDEVAYQGDDVDYEDDDSYEYEPTPRRKRSKLKKPRSSSNKQKKRDLSPTIDADRYGHMLLALLVFTLVLLWFWFPNLRLIDNPRAKLNMVIIAVWLGTSILIYLDATHLGAGTEGGKSPVGWAWRNVLIWIIFTPWWLGYREQLGGKRLFLPGLLLSLAVAFSLANWNMRINDAIEALQRKFNSF